jgi:hypothetical protein
MLPQDFGLAIAEETLGADVPTLHLALGVYTKDREVLHIFRQASHVLLGMGQTALGAAMLIDIAQNDLERRPALPSQWRGH